LLQTSSLSSPSLSTFLFLLFHRIIMLAAIAWCPTSWLCTSCQVYLCFFSLSFLFRFVKQEHKQKEVGKKRRRRQKNKREVNDNLKRKKVKRKKVRRRQKLFWFFLVFFYFFNF